MKMLPDDTFTNPRMPRKWIINPFALGALLFLLSFPGSILAVNFWAPKAPPTMAAKMLIISFGARGPAPIVTSPLDTVSPPARPVSRRAQMLALTED